mmetsp:Transcript_37189/g.91943  ORF Transcript_37189/g.91943 Transcript_37189/m.91943 type:complete len:291 (+) Transcript_37189:884-1756(+)
MNVVTSSSISVMPVACWILANASPYDCTFSMLTCCAALSLAMFQLPLITFLRSLVSSSMLISPSLPSASWSLRRFFMNSFILRSCSISLPSSRHSASNAALSLSACARRAAISFCAWSRASYAMLEISMMLAISFFFSCSSFSIFLYTLSNATRSRRRLSISSRSTLLDDSASLNCTSALSSLFSSTFTCLFTLTEFSLAAWMPPMARRCSRIFRSDSCRWWSRSSTRRRSISILRVNRSAMSCSFVISDCTVGLGAREASLSSMASSFFSAWLSALSFSMVCRCRRMWF